MNFKVLAIAILSFLCLVSLSLYLILDFRSRPERIHSYFQSKKYLKVLKTLKSAKSISPEEYSYGSRSLSNFLKEENSTIINPKDGKKIAEKFSSDTGIPFVWNEKYLTAKDIYIPKLESGTLFFTKAILDRIILTSANTNPEETAALMEKALKEDPTSLVPEYSAAIIQFLLSSRISLLNSPSKENLIHFVHYLASREESDFKDRLFTSKGKNVNLRSGPGVENKNILKLKEETFAFQIDSDSRKESIAGVSGNWIQVYSFLSEESGWIFSAFLKKSAADSASKEIVEKQISKSGKTYSWDFNNWSSDSIPDGFEGTYIKTDSVAIDGEIGLVVFSPEEKSEIQKICRTLPGEANQIEFKYKYMSGSNPLKLFDINFKTMSGSVPSFQIEIDRESVIINRNKYILNSNSEKEVLNLKWNRQDSGITGILEKERESVISGIQPLQKIQENENFNVEICIPEPKLKSKSNASLFGFRFKK